MALAFEWDPAKAAANARKHRVAFTEAMTAFADPLGGVLNDAAHSLGEVRLVLLAQSSRGRLLGRHAYRARARPGPPHQRPPRHPL